MTVIRLFLVALFLSLGAFVIVKAVETAQTIQHPLITLDEEMPK